MSSGLEEWNRKTLELINRIPFVEEDLDYDILDKHRPYLDELDRIGKAAISVFDLFQKGHVYVSASYRKRLALPEETLLGPEGMDLLMHPGDRVFIAEAGYHFLKTALTRINDTIGEYKLVNDFRIRTSSDTWVRMTEQHRILETDIHGNIWLTLSIADISPDQNTEEPAQSRLVHQESGNIEVFPQTGRDMLYELSNRELEILKLISAGYASKQIAGKLHISVHTVNTHRRNIIEKLNAANTAEAVQRAATAGLVG